MQIKCNFFAEKSNSFTFSFVTLLQKGLRLWFRIGVWRRLNVHGVVVGLLKGDVLDERLGVDILLLHLTVGGDALSHHDAFRLRYLSMIGREKSIIYSDLAISIGNDVQKSATAFAVCSILKTTYFPLVMTRLLT